MSRRRRIIQASIACILAGLAGCAPEMGAMRFRPWHDPFDTLKPATRSMDLTKADHDALREIVRRCDPKPRPATGARYSPGFPPIGTLYIEVNDSTERACECWEDRFDCRGEPELRIPRAQQGRYKALMRAIDSVARFGDSAPAPRRN